MQHWLIWTNKSYETLNTLRPRQNGRHFTDNIFKCILLNENVWISIITSLKFAPKSQVDNIPTVVQIMAWWQPGNKPLSEPMMVSFTAPYICITQPQWVNETQTKEAVYIYAEINWSCWHTVFTIIIQINSILPKGPYPWCLHMADRALLAGYPRNMECDIGYKSIKSKHKFMYCLFSSKKISEFEMPQVN